MTVAQTFGAFGAALQHQVLTDDVIHHAKRAVVDWYAALIPGAVEPPATLLEQALREGHLIPVCFVSAKSGAGVAELLDVIVKLLPNPTEGNPPDFLNGEGADAKLMHAEPDPAKHVLAHVFKVTADPFVGKLGIFRVHQGTVRRDAQLLTGWRNELLSVRAAPGAYSAAHEFIPLPRAAPQPQPLRHPARPAPSLRPFAPRPQP